MTNKIEDLKGETTEYLEINSIDVDYIIDHLSQNDRWKALIPDDMVVVKARLTKKCFDLLRGYENREFDATPIEIYKAMIAAQGE
jgi:hypothetical protein